MAWKPPATDIEATAWTPPNSDMEIQSQPVDMNAGLNKVAGTVNSVMEPLGRASDIAARGFSNFAFGSEKPAEYAEQAVGAVGQGIQKLGEGVSGATGYAAARLANATGSPVPPAAHYASAAAGLAISQIPQLLLARYMAGNKSISGKILEPQVPAERQAAVQAAREAGVPLSRAEMTGGKFITGLENRTEKTPLGGIPMGQARAQSDAAMQSYLDRLQNQMGTPKENFDVGIQAKPAMAARDLVMRNTRNEMFNAVPDDVSIPLTNAKNIADTLVDEQSKLYQGTQSPEVMRWSKIVQDAESSKGLGVTGGPEVQGITTEIPDRTIPASSRNVQSSLMGENGKPLSYQEQVPAKNIPGGSEYGVQYNVGPETQFASKPNYFALKKLRENLGEAIGQAKDAGKYQDYRDLTRLKSGLDSDIESFANAPASPLDSMVAQEFKSTYGKANAFSGAYKKLFKGDLATQIEKAPPEKILGMVFQKNNETAIKQFRALIGDEAFQTAKRKWVSDLLQSPNVAQALSEKKIDPGTLNAILSKPEQEALQKYGSVQGIRKTVGNLQGTQGSARSNMHNLSYEGLGGGLVGLGTGHPGIAAAGIGQFVAPYAVGKALTSNALREGINYSISPMARQAAYASFISKITTKDNQ